MFISRTWRLAVAIHINSRFTFGFMIDLGQLFEFRDTGYLLVRVQERNQLEQIAQIR